jgi:hypothetical protein
MSAHVWGCLGVWECGCVFSGRLDVKFQALEKSSSKVPMVGKSGAKSSNGWKKRRKKFQSLEKLALNFPSFGNADKCD